MSVNTYKKHIVVLPEDDANRQIANGFLLEPRLKPRVIQVLSSAGGWIKVLDSFREDHAKKLIKKKERIMLLLIDFDRNKDRLDQVKEQIPDALIDRVFVLGVLSEPEALKKNLSKSFENIGKSLAQDCVEETDKIWGHDLLKHNKIELDRMVSSVRPFLFK